MSPPRSPSIDLHDQVIRQNCRTLKTPAIAAQYQRLAEAAAREGHSHVRYLDALLGAEIEERERKAVLRRVKEARLPRLKTLQEFDFAQSPGVGGADRRSRGRRLHRPCRAGPADRRSRHREDASGLRPVRRRLRAAPTGALHHRHGAGQRAGRGACRQQP